MQDQTPNTDPIQEQPEQQEPIFTEIQHPNVSMTLHKILIYFLLWLWAVLRLFEGFSEYILLDLGEPLVEGGPPLTAQFFLWIAVLLNLGLAVFCIVTRFKLAKLKKGSPKLLSIVFGLTAAAIVMEVIFFMANGDTDLGATAGQLAMNVVLIFACRKYYQARDYMFVN